MNNATDIMRNLLDQGLLRHTEEEGQVVPVASFEEYQQMREMKELEAQSQQARAPSMVQNEGGQFAAGSSLVENSMAEDSVMTAHELNHAGPAFLPDAERARPGMQLEEMIDQPLTVQGFMNQPDGADEDPDKLGGSNDGLLQWTSAPGDLMALRSYVMSSTRNSARGRLLGASLSF